MKRILFFMLAALIFVSGCRQSQGSMSPTPSISTPTTAESAPQPFTGTDSTTTDPVKENVRKILLLCSQDTTDVDRYSLDELHRRYPGLEDILSLDFSGLTHFPLSLEKLYWEDDPQTGATREKGFQPFVDHLGGSHPYGPGCWYMHPGRRLPVMLAGDAVVTDWLNRSLDDTIREADRWRAVYDGVEVYEEAVLTCYFAPDLYANYGHLAILKSLVDELKAKGVLHLAAGTVIGYVANGPTPDIFFAPDFRLMDLKVDNQISAGRRSWIDHLVCPLTYYTEEMQSEIREYYDKYTYADMVKYGNCPEPWIDGPLNINIPDTVWGVWYHQTGLAPDLRGGNEDYPRAVISFIHPSKWSTETFWSPPAIDPYRSVLPGDLSGLYGESRGSDHPEVTAYGKSYLFLAQGDGTGGIFKMESIDTGTVTFMKYMVLAQGAGELDNLLAVKYFDSLAAGRADDMTSGTVVYSRQWEIVRGSR